MIGKQAVPRGNAKQLGEYLMGSHEHSHQAGVKGNIGRHGTGQSSHDGQGAAAPQDSHAKKLAEYLIKHDKNEKVRVLDIYGCASRSVAGAMQEMADIGDLSKCKQYIFHMAFRTPDGVNLTDAQKLYAIETYEKLLGLTWHQRVVVVHENQGHEHVHVVWNRVDKTARATHMGFSKLKIHAASRILEHDFGHEYVQSGEYSHGAVCGILKDHGREDVVRWIEQEQQRQAGKVVRESYSHNEEHQARAKKIDLAQVSRDCTAAWNASDTGKGLAAALDERGYILAKGTKRDFVVVDGAGGVHSLPRRIEGATTKDIQARCGDLDKMAVPTIDQAKAQQGAREQAGQEREREKERSLDERAAAQIKTLERSQELRMNRQERLVDAQFKQREKQVLERVKPPEPEAELGAVGKVYETIAKAIVPTFKTRDERQKEKEKKHRQTIEAKKKRVENEKKEKLAAYVQRDEQRRQAEKQKLDKELADKKKAPAKQKSISKDHEMIVKKPPDKDQGRER